MNKGLTFEQHVHNGQRLRQAWAALMETRRALGLVMPKTAPALRHIDRTIDRFNSLRTVLDSQIGRDCPDVSYDKLNHVYFGFRLQERPAASGESR